jgi:hypothetical protein
LNPLAEKTGFSQARTQRLSELAETASRVGYGRLGKVATP